MMMPAAFVPSSLSRGDALAGAGLARAESVAECCSVELGTLGRRGVAALVKGDVRDLLAEYEGFAAALADPGMGDRTRRNDVSRALALARAQQAILDVLLGEALARRDFDAAEMTGKQADRIAKRIDSLLTQHRAEFAPKRPVVVVKAENANVLALEGVCR
jgi:hypothetical protein